MTLHFNHNIQYYKSRYVRFVFTSSWL